MSKKSKFTKKKKSNVKHISDQKNLRSHKDNAFQSRRSPIKIFFLIFINVLAIWGVVLSTWVVFNPRVFVDPAVSLDPKIQRSPPLLFTIRATWQYMMSNFLAL